MSVELPKPIRFGFLPVDWVIEFSHGQIVPIPEFKEVLRIVKKRLHHDGHIYPPFSESTTVVGVTKGKKARTTKRPAFLYPPPPSHNLFISPPQHESDIREGSAGFILHLLGFLFQTRLQFADWFYDGRMPIDWVGRHVLNPQHVGRELSLAYKTWLDWPTAERHRFTNILYMYSRRFVHEWEWEEFVVQYMVFDACWKMAEKLFHLKTDKTDKKRGMHEKRIMALRGMFSLPGDDFIDAEKLVNLRNNLFHEALWHDGRPGYARSRLGYSMPIRLSVMNEALIFGILKKCVQQQK